MQCNLLRQLQHELQMHLQTFIAQLQHGSPRVRPGSRGSRLVPGCSNMVPRGSDLVPEGQTWFPQCRIWFPLVKTGSRRSQHGSLRVHPVSRSHNDLVPSWGSGESFSHQRHFSISASLQCEYLFLIQSVFRASLVGPHPFIKLSQYSSEFYFVSCVDDVDRHSSPHGFSFSTIRIGSFVIFGFEPHSEYSDSNHTAVVGGDPDTNQMVAHQW